jgi:hypothetical protein
VGFEPTISVLKRAKTVNKELRAKFKPKGGEVTNEWTKLLSSGELTSNRPVSKDDINIVFETRILWWKHQETHMVEVTVGYKVWEPSMESSHRLRTSITDPQQY